LKKKFPSSIYHYDPPLSAAIKLTQAKPVE